MNLPASYPTTADVLGPGELTMSGTQAKAFLASAGASPFDPKQPDKAKLDKGREDARKARIQPVDVVIGLSASGGARYVLGAMAEAREWGHANDMGG